MAAKSKKESLSKAEIKRRERRALEILVEQGYLKEIRQLPLPAKRRRPEHPPIKIEGEPVSDLLIRERR